MFLGFVSLVAVRNVLTADLVQRFDPLFFTCIVALCVFVAAAIYRTSQFRLDFAYQTPATRRLLLMLGCTTSVGLIGSTLALEHISPVLLVLIEVSVYPVLSSTIAYFFARGENVRFQMIILVLGIALPGIVLFSWPDLQGDQLSASLAGIVLTLVGSLGWASSVVLVANLVRGGAPIVDVIGFRFLVPGLLVGMYLLLSGGIYWDARIPAVMLVGFLTYFFPFFLLFSALRQLTIVTMGVYTLLGPLLTYGLVAVLWGVWQLEAVQMVGAGMIFVGLALRIRSESQAVSA